MEVRVHVDAEVDTAVVMTPVGTLDAISEVSLWDAVDERLNDTTPSLLLDLSAVDLITSAGIGTMVRIFHRIQSLGGTMVVFGANPRVRQVIEIVMLGEILGLCDSIEEARGRL